MKGFLGMKTFLGVALIGLALAIAIIPQYTSCAYNGKAITLANGKKVDMKCNWTAHAELATAVPIGIVGAVMPFSKKKEGLRNLAVMGVVLGAFAIMLPTDHLIGVCKSNMDCKTVMKPTLTALGSIVIGASMVGLVISQRHKEKEL